MSDVMLDGELAKEMGLKPRLFYYCDAVDAWIPADDKMLNNVDPCNFDNKEEWQVRFKRIDMTDYELNNLPSD